MTKADLVKHLAAVPDDAQIVLMWFSDTDNPLEAETLAKLGEVYDTWGVCQGELLAVASLPEEPT